MHPTVYILVDIEVFTTFTTSLTVSIGPGSSQNALVGIDMSVNSSEASPFSSPEPSVNIGLLAHPKRKNTRFFLSSQRRLPKMLVQSSHSPSETLSRR